MTDEWKQVSIAWQGDLVFEGVSVQGGQVKMGVDPQNPVVSPMELLLMGLAGCTGYDVVSILKKRKITLDSFCIEVRGKRAENHPRVYTEIEMVYRFWGDSLDPKAVVKAIQLSEEKYCSASAMLGQVARINWRYEINKV